ncbi:putative HD superfamily hydrolase of NAD metabolism [Lachnospiraceae bacterium C7]|nr:putative HD superfamily hydrolase of NAD metabolism [Lachnospiraceae bacterium C7]
MNIDIKALRKKLKKELDKDRYEHTKGVMYTSACLAMAYQYDINKAMVAGLLHDCAKCIPNDEKIKICKKNNVEITKIEMENPFLLHSKAGAVVARKKYDITDEEILHAIKVHTTGVPNMSLLDKIVFVADYIEPKRDKAPRLEFIRKMAFKDINKCVAYISYDTLHFLKSKKGSIDPTSEVTYDYYKEYIKDDMEVVTEEKVED